MSEINRSRRRRPTTTTIAAATLAAVVPAVLALSAAAPAGALAGSAVHTTAFNPACASPTGPLGPFGPLGPAGPFGPGGIVSQNPSLFYGAWYSVWIANPAVGGLSQTCFGLDLTGIVPPPL